MQHFDLNGAWSGACISPDGQQEFTFSGCVPGCVHIDLAGSRIPEDIFYRDNAEDCQWIEDRDWQYTRTFALEHVPANATLVFEGLDTYADIYLNGTLLGTADNMFIRHSFDAAALLRAGENTVQVYFHSPIRAVAGLPERTGAFTRERLHTRRIQCTYGWDWVGRFVTCGIWRDVYLELGSGFAVQNAYIYTEALCGSSAQIAVEAELDGYENGIMLDIRVDDPCDNCVYSHRVFCQEPLFRTYIDIPNAQLWYPHGYGDQPLYTLHIGGKIYPFGIRTVVIEQLTDTPGSAWHQKCLQLQNSPSGKRYDQNESFSGFRLLINGIPILCKGANWVPCEPFPSAETDEKITTLLSLAREAGLNMMRVWGGGIFEKQHFYAECDRLGILVTQDFLMACGHYPEETPEFIAQLRKETEFAAYALRNHPCLVWWSGDNENAIMGYDEAEDYQGRTAIYQGILPVLSKLDPRRRFLPSSPYGGKLYASKTVGTTHNTQYLSYIFRYIRQEEMADYKEYFATYLARFIAEEPTMGAVALPSLRRFMTDEDIFSGDAMWQYHTKGNPALSFTLFDITDTFARKVLGDFADGADRYFKLKYVQYEWVRITMENVRRNRGFINGTVYWMWNDCWPAASGWAFVDYYCLPKASFYSFKRCAGQLIVSIDKSHRYDVYLCNDSLTDQAVTLSLSYIENGQVVTIADVPVTIGAASAGIVYSLPLSAVPQGAVLICDAAGDGFQDRAFYKDGGLPMVPCTAPTVVSRTDDSITLTSDQYIHAVELEGEYIFSDNYFSLLPGQQRTITMRPAADAQTHDLTVAGYTLQSET